MPRPGLFYLYVKFPVSLYVPVHKLVCMGKILQIRQTRKGAIAMTERWEFARTAEPPQQDVDDLIFPEQTGLQASQR